jgi:hypothetical protein
VATVTLSSEKATEEETDLGENIQEFGSGSSPASNNTDPLRQDAVVVDEQEVEKKKATGEQRALSTGTLVIVLAVCGTLLVIATIILSLGVLTYRRCSRRSPPPPQDASSPGYSLHSLDNTRF